MSVSSLDDSRLNFQLLENCYQVPYGDADALENIFRSRCKSGDKPDICAFIVEAIHGTRIISPPRGYLRKVRDLCTQYDVLLILDEIYTGFGRTGYWFAFEAEGIVPDIVCYSKTFGGGKATIAGYTVRGSVFLEAYGKPEDAMMHSSTYSGMSEECATAIEALNILKEDKLIERAKALGEYLGPRLTALKGKYPDRISEVRGRGLLWGIDLKPPLEPLENLILRALPSKPPFLSTLTGAVVLSELFCAYDVLAYLGFTRRNLIVFSPALIVNERDLDRAVEALDAVLSSGWLALGRSFIARQFP
jgi:acetylornithine/succinyldiaminopimelate/putrescine aminotransferase